MFLIDCHKASIYTIDNEYLCDAHVSHIADRSALLTFEEPYGDILRSEALVTFYDNAKGLVSCSCRLSDYKEYAVSPGVKHSSALCSFGEVVTALQRRNDLKVRVDLPARLSYTDSEGNTIRSDASIRDISAGGVFVICSCTLCTGQQFSLSFRAGQKELLLTAEVIRIDDAGYGCRFPDMTSSQEASVRSFVFQQDSRNKRF